MDITIHASFLPHDDPDTSLACGAEVVQEPTEQPYGVRDCAVRDPAGNLLRIQELR
jgi:catechol 2,3-dioxygenase-like lactoylglutathione lyase family enzyme